MLSLTEIHRMINSENTDSKRSAAYLLGKEFDYLENKDDAWQYIHRLTMDKYEDVRKQAAYALQTAFPYLPDKPSAWQDLRRLTSDQDMYVRGKAAEAIGSAFAYLPDKYQAWLELHRLTQDQTDNVRERAAKSLGLAFPQLLDKSQAWNDLHKLTQDNNGYVREGAAESLGSAFPYIPNRDLASQDLHKLTKDEEEHVRCFAYHSLGRVSILNASEAKNSDEFKDQLEMAIGYFERALKEVRHTNPAAFCLPFYKSLHGLFFTDISKDEEIQRYLAEAKRAVKGSERKEILLEAVDNLSKALLEVKTFTVTDMVQKKRDLRAYTRYCFQAADCLEKVRHTTPVASKLVDATMVEKGIPIIDEKIKKLFEDVENAAQKLCKRSKGTILEDVGKSTYDSTKGLSEVSSPIAADIYLLEIVQLLKAQCIRLPKEAQDYLKTLMESQDTATLEQRFEILKLVLITSLSQAKTITNIYGDVQGNVLSGMFYEGVNVNSAEGKQKRD